MTDPGTLARRVRDRLLRLEADRIVPRIWARDPSVWSDDPAAPELGNRLGWLDLPDTMPARVDEITAFAEEARRDFDRVVLCGMGGSSLAPEVLWRTFGPREGYPALHLLDSTHPDAVAAVDGGDLARTLFLIASKSGTTIETASFDRHFWERAGRNGAQFAAVTDADTALARSAADRGFRRVFLSPGDVGGRFSALSPFGLVPAALIGVDLRRFLDRAREEAAALRRPALQNTGALLGVTMGEGALAGRDKLTVVLDRPLASLGLWVEQLVAESTGKAGRGVLPVTGEEPDALQGDEPDRLWVARTLGDAAPRAVARLMERLEQHGVPVEWVRLGAAADLAGEFLRFEFATAVAGALLRVNPFEQPNVAESKANTARMLVSGTAGAPPDAAPAVREWLDGVRAGDYVAILAYLAPSAPLDVRLGQLRAAIARRCGVAVTAAYGPRYLHSTGQLHKGGPARGHFLQLVDSPAQDLPVPGERYGFARLIAAQAEGDREALRARDRPVVRVADWSVLEQVL